MCVNAGKYESVRRVFWMGHRFIIALNEWLYTTALRMTSVTVPLQAEIVPAFPFLRADVLSGSGRIVSLMAVLCCPVGSAIFSALLSAAGEKAEIER